MPIIIYDPPRPILNDDIKQAAAVNFVREHSNIQDQFDLVDLAFDIAEAHGTSMLMDDYELAKKLEDHFNWQINAQTVASLDDVSVYMRKRLREEERLWVKNHNIQPPFAIGTVVMFQHGGMFAGTITGISEHEPATYLIQKPGEPENCRAVVKFEDCWLWKNKA